METPKQHQREELLTKERLIYRRDQRLVLLLRMLVGVFFFGTLSTIPIFIGGGPMATMGLVCFFALMAMAIVHMVCFILAKRKRYVLARKIVFPVLYGSFSRVFSSSSSLLHWETLRMGFSLSRSATCFLLSLCWALSRLICGSVQCCGSEVQPLHM